MKSKLIVSFLFVAMIQVWAFAQVIDSRNAVADPNGNILWHDCSLLTVEGKGWSDTESFYDRLPAKASKIVRKPVWILSRESAGLLVRFHTDAPSIQVRWTLTEENLAMPHMPATGVSGIDLYAMQNGKWRFKANGRPLALVNTAAFELAKEQDYMIYLPLYNGVKSIEIGLDKKFTLSKPAPRPQKPIVFYGTSITQGGCASRPGMAATAIVGRKLDLPVINLGFSGNGKMDPEMADLLTELDPRIYVIDCLGNMHFDDAEKLKRIHVFVKKLRSVRPDTPILLVEDSSLKNEPTPKGAVLKKAYDSLLQDGIKNLHLLSNKDMLGDDGEATVDGGHLTDLGMMRQADVFVKAIVQILEGKQTH